MCGIVGCKLKRPLNKADIERMQRLRDAMSYRGPDDSGEDINADEGLYFGHRRLSIIDLDPRSAQPMKTDKATITFNGEIYNYLELREELKPHYTFKTQSDTEVLLRAWDKWGPASLDRIDGMYAFALSENQSIHLITDLFGEKPIYLYEDHEGYYFSSEAGPLIAEFNLQFAPSNSELSEFLYLGYIRAPKTGYKNLYTLPPASHYQIKRDGSLSKRLYWQPPSPFITKGKIHPFNKATIKKTGNLLSQSLEKRLRADVPLGLFLSGGVDSALTAALAAKELGVKLQAYTVAFPDGQDETPSAKAIATHLGLQHIKIDSTQDDLWKETPTQLLDFYGVPNDNTTVFAIYQMCQAVRQHLKIAISGLGGDEVFYGYNKYETFYKNRHFYQAAPFLQIMTKISQILPNKKLQLAQDLLRGDVIRQYLRIKNGAGQNLLESIFPHLPDNFLRVDIEELAHQARYFDLVDTMPQSYIPANDRGSMRGSIEVRTPFLNRELLEFIWTLDQRALIAFGKKNLAQSVLKQYMPLDLLTKTKQGFVFPLDRYFKQGNITAPHLPQFSAQGINATFEQAHKGQNQRIALRLLILAKILG